MLNALFFFLFSFALTSFIGYWAHRAFHKEWTLRLHKAHSNHHWVQYPPHSLISTEYRSAGRDNSVWLFFAAAIPLIAIILSLYAFSVISLLSMIALLLGMGTTSFLHDYFHDKFHVSPNWWERFGYFKRLRDLHFKHHIDTQKNFGIFFFTWDRLFKTFTKDNES